MTLPLLSVRYLHTALIPVNGAIGSLYAVIAVSELSAAERLELQAMVKAGLDNFERMGERIQEIAEAQLREQLRLEKERN